jgi:hypothetical protein
MPIFVQSWLFACTLGKPPPLANGSQMVRERQADAFDRWLGDVEGSGIKELVRFAHGLRRDDSAVRGADHELEQWSDGGPRQPTQNDQANNVRARWFRSAPQPGPLCALAEQFTEVADEPV